MFADQECLDSPKDLALIKSFSNSLKSCETHFDFDAISQSHGFSSVILSLFMLIIHGCLLFMGSTYRILKLTWSAGGIYSWCCPPPSLRWG
jgi:hypothetical protein